MKRILLFPLILLCWLFLYQNGSATGTLPDPSLSAGEILEDITRWQEDIELPGLPGGEGLKPYLELFGAAAGQLADRMDYKIYAYKVTGRTAAVDVSVSAVRVGGTLRSLLAQSATYLTFQRLLGRPADLGAYLSGRIAALIAEQPSVTTQTSMYLILGGDGGWKLDLSDSRNLPLLEAVLGAASS